MKVKAKWFIDESRWNKLSDDQMRELVANGMVGLFFKMGQGLKSVDRNAQEHSDQADRLNIPKGGYVWPDPIERYPQEQAKAHVELAKRFGVKTLALDMEQYWADWGEWYRIKVLKEPGTLRVIPALELWRFYDAYVKEVMRLRPKGMKVIGYSARWFIQGYCRNLAVTIRDQLEGYWNAAYFAWQQADSDPNVTWDEFANTINQLNPPDSLLPSGIREWTAWQFAILPMAGFPRLDINLIDPDQVKAIFGRSKPKPPPIDDPPPVSDKDGVLGMTVLPNILNMRTSPNVLKTNDVGDLEKGDVVSVYDIGGSDAWVRITPLDEDPVWACAQQGKDRYLSLVEPEEPQDELEA